MGGTLAVFAGALSVPKKKGRRTKTAPDTPAEGFNRTRP